MKISPDPKNNQNIKHKDMQISIYSEQNGIKSRIRQNLKRKIQ